MFALENPPYYACQWGTTSMLVCVGGLESDENCHTFTEEDPASPKRDIIKGLYVCGNVQAAATQWNTPSACAASATACASTTATSPARTAWPVSDTLLTEH